MFSVSCVRHAVDAEQEEGREMKGPCLSPAVLAVHSCWLSFFFPSEAQAEFR